MDTYYNHNYKICTLNGQKEEEINLEWRTCESVFKSSNKYMETNEEVQSSIPEVGFELGLETGLAHSDEQDG